MTEEWRQMEGHPKFLISNRGRISNHKGKIYETWINHEGYEQVVLCEKGHKFVAKVHQEVAKAFIPRVEGKTIINHIDGVKTNNNVENLEWSTYSLNVKHALALGLSQTPDPVRRKVRCVESGKVFVSLKEAGEKTGAYASHISACCNGERQTTGGYHWEYADQDAGEKIMKVPVKQTSASKDEAFMVQLNGIMTAKKMGCQEVANALGISLQTFYRRRETPSTFTLGEIRALREIFPSIEIK